MVDRAHAGGSGGSIPGLPAVRPGDTAIDDLIARVSGRPLLEGETILLTGAAGGIGQVLVAVLLAAGARIAATDACPFACEPDGRERGEQPSVVTGVFDASDPQRFDRFRASAEETLGPITGIVNCAGAWGVCAYEELEPRDLLQMVDANLITAFVGCKAVLPGMVERRRGSVVNFASTAGEYGSISPAIHYAAAKGGVIALTKSLAREVSHYNVRVNAISPGPIDTPALGADTPEKKRDAGARTLLNRLGRPEEIAVCSAFLLSPLSAFMTGQVLRVNGGSLL